MIKAAIHKSLRLFGLDIARFPPRDKDHPHDFDKAGAEVIRAVRPWTMTRS